MLWTHAEDGVRLRLGHWCVKAAIGTVFLFPGRTEYLEKYGRVAADLTGSGFDVLSIDWRGQGYSDRVTDDPRLGHVDQFSDYQRDVQTLVDFAKTRDLPKPWMLLAHSMGGCIGLRALVNEMPVEKAVFSAPMWGIFVLPRLRPIARVLPKLARTFGQELRPMPGTGTGGYVLETRFEDNLLTTDADTWEYLKRHARASEKFALGGPTVQWFEQARIETKALKRTRRPSIPVKTFAGTREGIIDRKALIAMHQHWPSAELSWIEGARHELMMEAPAMRLQFMQETLAFFRNTDAPVVSS